MMGWFEAMGESPRGFVICCVAMIDDELTRLIRRKMESEEDFYLTTDRHGKDEARSRVIDSIFNPVKGGSLQSIHAKRQLAYAMAWIDDVTYHDIGVLAKIRNLFAHERVSPTFDDPVVHKLVRKLKFPLWVYDEKDLEDIAGRGGAMVMFHAGSELQFDTLNDPFAKTLFLTSVHMIVSNFQEEYVYGDDSPSDSH